MVPNRRLNRFSYFVNAYPFSTFASTENKLGLGSCKTILPLKYSAFLLVHSLQKRQIEQGLVLYLALGSAKVSSFLKHPFHLLVKEQPSSQFFFSVVDSFLIVLLASQFSQPYKGIAPIKSQKGSHWSLDTRNRKHL